MFTGFRFAARERSICWITLNVIMRCARSASGAKCKYAFALAWHRWRCEFPSKRHLNLFRFANRTHLHTCNAQRKFISQTISITCGPNTVRLWAHRRSLSENHKPCLPRSELESGRWWGGHFVSFGFVQVEDDRSSYHIRPIKTTRQRHHQFGIFGISMCWLRLHTHSPKHNGCRRLAYISRNVPGDRLHLATISKRQWIAHTGRQAGRVYRID